MRVHLSNGLYANAVFDKLLRSFVISETGINLAARYETLMHKTFLRDTQVVAEIKHPSVDRPKVGALNAGEVTTIESSAFKGLGLSIAVILFGILGLPAFLMSFYW
jgi:hypothetical protein